MAPVLNVLSAVPVPMSVIARASTSTIDSSIGHGVHLTSARNARTMSAGGICSINTCESMDYLQLKVKDPWDTEAISMDPIRMEVVLFR